MKAVRITRHAREEMERRGIAESIVRAVLDSPDEVVPALHGLSVRQSIVRMGEKTCLVRVVVADRPGEDIVVTVYRTSKLAKYRRKQ